MGVGLLRFNQGDVYQRGLAALAVASLLVAAGAGEGDARSRLRDAKPHTGVAAAHTMPVQGIDVSYWQGDIDGRARAGGIHFVPSGDRGGDHVDPKSRD
jgi:lysozyme